MSSRFRKYVLVIIALAMAVAPLRGALALPVMAAANDTSHCEQMQNDVQDATAVKTAHVCDQGCSGDCCDGACNVCAHGPVALSGTLARSQDNHITPLNIIISYGISGRTVHPPFRPPISLQS